MTYHGLSQATVVPSHRAGRLTAFDRGIFGAMGQAEVTFSLTDPGAVNDLKWALYYLLGKDLKAFDWEQDVYDAQVEQFYVEWANSVPVVGTLATFEGHQVPTAQGVYALAVALKAKLPKHFSDFPRLAAVEAAGGQASVYYPVWDASTPAAPEPGPSAPPAPSPKPEEEKKLPIGVLVGAALGVGLLGLVLVMRK